MRIVGDIVSKRILLGAFYGFPIWMDLYGKFSEEELKDIQKQYAYELQSLRSKRACICAPER